MFSTRVSVPTLRSWPSRRAHRRTGGRGLSGGERVGSPRPVAIGTPSSVAKATGSGGTSVHVADAVLHV